MDNKTYAIIEGDSVIFTYDEYHNRKGFSKCELVDYLAQECDLKEKSIICIEDEIQKYNIKGNENHINILPKDAYNFETWYTEFNTRGLNGFNLPIRVTSNKEYIEKIEIVLQEYVQELSRPPFVYYKGFLDTIKSICFDIIHALKFCVEHKIHLAEIKIKEILNRIAINNFFVNDLNKCYSFRGIAPFPEFYRDGLDPGYKAMCNDDLFFFRARTKIKDNANTISSLEDIVHLPYKLREKARNMRFSSNKKPALYLGTTSFVCATECKWKENTEDLYVSAFVPNEKGKQLKILNLTVSQALINGFASDVTHAKLQRDMLIIFPVVIATSFENDDDTREEKYEYFISQMLLKLLYKFGIDGIAYLSMKGKNEFQYPHGVNLVLPAYDISKNQEYSQYCRCFNITKPQKMNSKVMIESEYNKLRNKKETYINTHYPQYKYENEYYLAKVNINDKDVFYGNTKFALFDNYLASMQFEIFGK